MKSKSRLILVGLVLLLSAVGVSAAPAAPSATAPQPAVADANALPFLCNLNQSVNAELPKTGDLVPSPVQASAVCGACSAINCANHQVGGFCGTGPAPFFQQLHCLQFDLVCSQDGRNQCRCAFAQP